MNNLKKFLIQNLLSNKEFLILSGLILFLLFAYLHKASINNDAHFWYFRSENFVNGILEGKFNETYQNAKPGVSVMWISGFSLFFGLNFYDSLFGWTPEVLVYDTHYFTHFLVVAPLLLISYLSIVVLYFFLCTFFNKKIALNTVILLSLQPFFLGISRHFHADSTLSAFMLISAVFAILYFEKKNSWFLVFSAIFGGLSLLTKSSGLYIFLYFGLVSLFYYDNFKNLLKTNAFWFFLSFFTFYILFPAMWVKPFIILERIFLGEVFTLVTNPIDGYNPSILGYLPDFFRVFTPVLILLSFGGIVKTIKEKNKIALLILLFGVFYFLQMSLVSQKMDRYLFPLMPSLAFLGAYFISKFKYSVLATFLVSIVFVVYFFPNYLLYPIESLKDQFGCSMCSYVGDYLNKKENPYGLKIVYSSNKLHRLKPYIKGRVYSPNEELPNNWNPEYYVSTTTESLPERFNYCTLEHIVTFRSIEYMDIYSCKN
jgi:hypothetical protein